MDTREAFISDIRENPNDDTPRLIFADWLQDHEDEDLGEFIRIQIRRSRLALAHSDHAPLFARESELLRANWHSWVRSLWPLVDDGGVRLFPGIWLRDEFTPSSVNRFHRGFIDLLSISTSRFLVTGEELTRRLPLRILYLHEPSAHGQKLADTPALKGIQQLFLADPYRDPVNAGFMRELASSPWLQNLRWLDLQGNNLGDQGCAELARACWIAGVKNLTLADNGMTSIGIRYLASTTYPFRPRRLVLNNNPLEDAGVVLLARSPVLMNVEELSLQRCGIGPAGAEALARSPHLRCLRRLVLADNPLGAEGWNRLSNAPWRIQLQQAL